MTGRAQRGERPSRGRRRSAVELGRGNADVTAREPVPDITREGAGSGAAFALFAERLKDARQGIESLVDPFGIVSPFAHAHVAWGLHPMEFAELAMRYAADLSALQLNIAAKLAGRDVPDVVCPQPADQRFSDPVWKKELGWDVLKQGYLFSTRHVQEALERAPGLSFRQRRRAVFWWRNWRNAVAPTNFLLTNPVAARKAIESRGDSLRRGFEIFLEDMRAGTVRMTDPEDFQVGGNLATTAGAVVFRNRLLELIHYAPVAKRVRPTPIVIVTPWINKFYVLDLEPRNSLVRYLLQEGFDVYITSWKNPGADLAETRFDDYLTQGVHEAVRVARALSGAAQVHACGYCIGGTLLAVYMAWLARRHPDRASVPVAHWTLLASLVDFQSPGDIEVFIDEGSVRWLSQLMRTRGFLEGREMAATFRLLRSNSLIWHYVVHGWLYGERPAPHAVLYWNMDTTRMPYRMHDFYLRELYLRNGLVKPDALRIAGEPIDLAHIDAPLYQVATEDDHIAPWRQTFHVNEWVTGHKRFVLSSSGHILGIVNPPVMPPKRRFRVAPAHRGQAADAWHATSEVRAGSWWEDWRDWLGQRSGEQKAAPRELGNEQYQPGTPAPGSYVFEP